MAAERDPPAGAARPPGREVPAEGLHPRGLDRRYSPPCSRPPFLACRHMRVLTHTHGHSHTQSPCCLCRVCLSARPPFLLPASMRVTNDALGVSSPGQRGTVWGQVPPVHSGLEITHGWAPSWVTGGRSSENAALGWLFRDVTPRPVRLPREWHPSGPVGPGAGSPCSTAWVHTACPPSPSPFETMDLTLKSLSWPVWDPEHGPWNRPRSHLLALLPDLQVPLTDQPSVWPPHGSSLSSLPHPHISTQMCGRTPAPAGPGAQGPPTPPGGLPPTGCLLPEGPPQLRFLGSSTAACSLGLGCGSPSHPGPQLGPTPG